MQIVCKRNALAGERGQVEIRLGDPHTPLLFRQGGADGEMHRTGPDADADGCRTGAKCVRAAQCKRRALPKRKAA
jgi:hypothetical protein